MVVAVAKSEKKHTLFPLDERLELAREATATLPNVKCISFTGLLVDLADEVDAHAVVKGLRAITDFEYEFQMAALKLCVFSSCTT